MVPLKASDTISDIISNIVYCSNDTEVVFSLLFSGMMKNLTGAVLVLWRFSTYHIVLIIGGILFVLVKNHYERKESKINLEGM